VGNQALAASLLSIGCFWRGREISMVQSESKAATRTGTAADIAGGDLSGALQAETKSSLRRFLVPLACALLAASVLSHLAARTLGLPTPEPAYRRMGPETGPQAYCAGSSLLQFAFSWAEVSQAMGQGIENWGIGGSTPSEWEVFQDFATNSNHLILGLSVYDLNEQRPCDFRANFVAFGRTVRDLLGSDSSWDYSKRLLSQYPLAYLRMLFPTAGKSDAVLVGLRRKARELVKSSSALDDRAIANVVRQGSALEFGDSGQKISDWGEARMLRRLAMTRSETRGEHGFFGPKHQALMRMLERSKALGRITVVLLPVSPAYAGEFVDEKVAAEFAKVLDEVKRIAPEARILRLDAAPELATNDFYSDLVHLNGNGRKAATELFLKQWRAMEAAR